MSETDQFGRTPVQQAYDGLRSWISIQQHIGVLAPEIAEQAREYVETLYRHACPTICQDCGMAHGPDEPEKCIEGHGSDGEATPGGSASE